MSGIYIKNMEIPRGESEKALIVLNRDGEAVAYRVYNYDPHDEEPLPAWYEGRKCEAIEVPDHGRLIDADAFIEKQTEQICENCDRRRGMKDGKLTKRFVYQIGDAPCRACDTGDMMDYVDDAPVVIPADKEEDDC